LALFSDIDWLILAVAAAFLLFGKEHGELLRTLGRWYGRAGRLKQELLAEFSKAAEMSPPAPGAPLSVRGVLLGLDPPATARSGIPTAVRVPPPLPDRPVVDPTAPWTGSYPVPTWSMTVPAVVPDPEGSR